ncbi:MAG: fibronectin type III domain-containing protein, partial [Nitrososphaera sp.]|nr:fibronectin type III domain-containing protein [Nitrososphaera sp.]
MANNTSVYMLEESPGTAWAYNDYSINLYLKTLFTRVFSDTGGANPADSAAIQPNRLGALQLEDGNLYIPWSNGGWEIGASARDYARIAWFWLNKGNWNGTQLLPQSYFDAYMQVGVPRTLPLSSGTLHSSGDYLGVGTNGGPPNDGLAGNGGRGVYGFNWWFNGQVAAQDAFMWPDAPPDTFAGRSGSRGAVVVFPSLNMVVAARNPNWQSDGAGWGSEPYWDSETPTDPTAGFNQRLKLLVSAVTIVDDTPPSAPGSLSAQAVGQSVNLSWTASSDPESGVSSYRVYRDTVSGTAKTLLATVSGTTLSYTDSATAPNTTYYYDVSAVNGKGLESARSNEAGAVTGDDVPAAPTGLTATGGDTQVTLNWNDNVEADLSVYLVYRGTTPGGPYSQVASSTQSQFTDIGLTNGTTYYYVVSAVDLGNNESASSTEAAATPQEP